MNRLQFVKSAKSLLLYFPIAGIFKFNDVSKTESKILTKTSDGFFPDKDNYLTGAVCLFRTPGNGDGKNGDDSYVDAFVDIECYDNLYSGHGGLGDHTEIETNVVGEMPIGFSTADSKKIFYDGVKNINILILGHKPNQSGGENDKWNLRWEFLMQFKKGNILSTGYSDPQTEYNFGLEQTPINNPNIAGQKRFFPRKGLFNRRTIDESRP